MLVSESAALKGVVLSVLAYGNLGMRSVGDIDLLTLPSQVVEVERVLVGLGYKRSEPRAEMTRRRMAHYLRYYKHFTYFSEEKRVVIELHWRLFHNISLVKSVEATFPSTIPVTIGSGAVSTLSRNELFLYLCAHGSVHGWPILKWLSDIGALLRVMTAEDLGEICHLASERGLVGELRAALVLTQIFLDVEKPIVDLPKEGDRVVGRTVAMARRLLGANNYCLELSGLPRFGMFFYDLRMRGSWRYRSEDIRRSLFFPDDWELIDLPDALFPLYAAVRPISWLLRHLPHVSQRRSSANRSST